MRRKKETPQWTCTHIMADGTVCKDMDEVREYMRGKELPDLTKRLIVQFIRAGHKQMKEAQ